MTRHHDLKCWAGPDMFEALWRRSKTHEIRRDDRGFAEGDTVVIREWLPDRRAHTGRSVRGVIGHVSRPGAVGSNAGLPEGIVVFSFLEYSRATPNDYDGGEGDVTPDDRRRG